MMAVIVLVLVVEKEIGSVYSNIIYMLFICIYVFVYLPFRTRIKFFGKLSESLRIEELLLTNCVSCSNYKESKTIPTLGCRKRHGPCT